MEKILVAAVAATLGFSAVPANAATIAGLFNTGTDGTNTALAGGNGVDDPHYVIVASSEPSVVGQLAETYYNGAYLANDSNSRWVSITGTGTPSPHTATYRLTFDLTGLDPLTAMITGNWGTDNSGSISLNGVPTGNLSFGFGALTPFSINSGFLPGLNTLDFLVNDAGVVGAFRVDDISGTANLLSTAPVPEPATWAMMLLGFGAIGLAFRRRPQALAGAR